LEKRLTLAAAAALLALIGLLPLLTMVTNSFFVDGLFSLKAYQALWDSSRQQLVLMGQSLLAPARARLLRAVIKKFGCGVPATLRGI